MTEQTKRYNEALKIMRQRKATENRKKVLEAEESLGSVTITINPKELEILNRLVSNEVTKELRAWCAASSDEKSDVYEMACELANSDLREDRLLRLLNKLDL